MPGSSDTKADPATLNGYTEGAEILDVTVTSERVDAFESIVYAQHLGPGPVRQQHLTLLVPRSERPRPLVIYFPGGGFLAADRGRYPWLRMALARRGFVVASVEYSTVPATFPALVRDGRSAVRFLRAHAASWGIDAARVGVIGHSAGGYLAQMLGLTNGDPFFEEGDWPDVPSDVQAVVSVYGVYDLPTIGEGLPPACRLGNDSHAAPHALMLHGPAFRVHSGKSIRDDPEAALRASPMGHMGPGKPPFLILHGSADTLVSPLQSARLFQALREHGNDAEYVLVPGAEHGDGHWYQEAVERRIIDWFVAKLGDPRG